jgi:hypothetical protein
MAEIRQHIEDFILIIPNIVRKLGHPAVGRRAHSSSAEIVQHSANTGRHCRPTVSGASLPEVMVHAYQLLAK